MPDEADELDQQDDRDDPGAAAAVSGGSQADGSEAAEAAATVEAILFATDSPLPAAKIAQVAELPGVRAVRKAIEALNARYEASGCAFRIEALAGGYQMLTLPEYNDVLSRLLRTRSDSRLTKAAMETLAIVAYRQPILRADIEAIRGVATGEVLRSLLDKQVIKIVGRAEVPGRPMLYGTTRRFLELFGLNSLEDLPRVEELRSGAAAAAEVKCAPAEGAPAPLDQDRSPEAPAGEGDAEAADQAPPPETSEAIDPLVFDPSYEDAEAADQTPPAEGDESGCGPAGEA